MSLEQFDKNSEEILFNKVCQEYFSMLIKYDKSMKIKHIDMYWKGIKSNDV